MKNKEYIYAKNQFEWRSWLKENHDKVKEIWVIFKKKHTGDPCVSYNDAIEEALCFGWIDSIIQRIDSNEYRRKFSPRKPESKWSALNKKRVMKLVQEGRMTKIGIKKSTFTGMKDDYGRTLEQKKKDLIVPVDLKKAFLKNKRVWGNFNKLAPSYRRNYLLWIGAAKTKETRQRRISEAILLLLENRKLGMK